MCSWSIHTVYILSFSIVPRIVNAPYVKTGVTKDAYYLCLLYVFVDQACHYVNMFKKKTYTLRNVYSSRGCIITFFFMKKHVMTCYDIKFGFDSTYI
jgi:hypothetical protein